MQEKTMEEITLFPHFVLEFQLQHGGRLIIPLTALPVKNILLNIGYEYDHLILKSLSTSLSFSNNFLII